MDTVVVYGAVGGFMVIVLNLLEVASIPKLERPDFKDWLYWLPYLFWPLTGGFLVHLYVESKMTVMPLVAFNLGLSAPLTLKAMAQAFPTSPER
ncbi:TPA: hypothetical protein L3743_006038 [Pseudomonas aeruginosa]|uniref:hypothetical protein n=1 Tax=Pseudomonas aeruginosa TaxID=287 RepID=UPI001F0F7280|nr:hypothetical protein [Pseudomonas aeruginosa]HBN8672856.1 hypothetical protein [Pseudomonas aeruginosa]